MIEGKSRTPPATGIQYSHELITYHDQLSAVSEAYKVARTNIEFSSIDRRLRSLMVTSAVQTEGKTVTLANLAITYAQLGRSVLLVDADLRRPAVHRCFGYANRRGLTNILIGAGHYRDFILPTLTEKLSILPVGPIPPNPADLLMSQTMTDLIEALEQEYDLVLVDCPPVGAVADAAIVSTKVDATVFVVRANQTHKNQLKRAVALLKQVNAPVLGFIMNGVSEESDDYYYYYSQYYYQADAAADAGARKRVALADNHTRKRKNKTKNRKSSPAPINREFHAAPLVRQSNVPSAISGTQLPAGESGTTVTAAITVTAAAASAVSVPVPAAPSSTVPDPVPAVSYTDMRNSERIAHALRHFSAEMSGTAATAATTAAAVTTAITTNTAAGKVESRTAAGYDDPPNGLISEDD